MKTPKHSLRKIVSFLNNPDEDGGFMYGAKIRAGPSSGSLRDW